MRKAGLLKGRYLWLLLAGAAFGVAAWLMPSANPAAHPTSKSTPELQFPEQPGPAEAQTMRARRTLPPSSTAAPSTASGHANDVVVLAKRDPLLVALPSGSELVVFEAKTFFKRPLGQMFAGCMQVSDFAASGKSAGFDLEHVERVALANPWSAERLIAITGQLANVEPTRMFKLGAPVAYGSSARIFSPPGAPSDTPAEHGPAVFAGTWNGQMLFFSSSRQQIEQAIDRLDGRVPAEPAFPQDRAYSEIYGRITARSAADTFLSGAIAEQVARSDLAAQFHVDASDDVAVVIDATGSRSDARDVGKAMAAGLAARRLEAATIRDKRLSRLLDLYSVTPADDGFRLKAAFPLDYLHDVLGGCARQKPSAAARGAAGHAP
jgi:hypothetical protein